MNSTLELNSTLVEVNSTLKFIPTAEGTACAYLSLMFMSLIPILIGSFRSIKHQTETHAKCCEIGEQAETMTDRDAAMFPVIASCALFGFYLLIKIAPELLNICLSGYFFLLGVFAIYRLTKPHTESVFPRKYNLTQYFMLFGTKKSVLSTDDQDQSDRSATASPTNSDSSTCTFDLSPNEISSSVKFTHSDILAFILSAFLGIWYVLTKHWVANNAFGLAFALNGIELLPINSIRIGCILLCGLFFYDVFWVFGTDVMVSVAKGFDAPIKIMFPQDFLIRGFWGNNFAMLGLGDIVIPGIFIAFLLRFDKSLNRKNNVYFWSCFLAYIFGLGITIGVMSYFKHPQPALLYLVPCCILVPIVVAIAKRDFGALLKYRDYPQSSGEEKASSQSEINKHGNDAEVNTDNSTSISTRARTKKKAQ